MFNEPVALGPVLYHMRDFGMRTLLSVLTLSLLVISACGGRRVNAPQETGEKTTTSPLVVTVLAPAIIGHPGDPISLTAVLTNHGQAPITVCAYPGFRFELMVLSGEVTTAAAEGGQRRLRVPGATTDTPSLASDFTTLAPGGTTSVTRALTIPAMHGEVAAPMTITATFDSGATGIEHGYQAWTGKLKGRLNVNVSPR